MTLLTCLLRQASAAEPTGPVVFAVFVEVLPAAGTVLVVVLLVVEALLVCSVGVGCVLLVAQPSLAGLQPQSSVARRLLC